MVTLSERFDAQQRRKAELDALRTQRRLTEAEYAEDERLTSAAYMREWRAQSGSSERKAA